MTDEITEIFDYLCSRESPAPRVIHEIQRMLSPESFIQQMLSPESFIQRMLLVGAEVCREIEEWN